MMQDMNVLVVGFYFRLHLRNSVRNMQLGNLDVLIVSLEVWSEINVQVGDMMYLLTAIGLPAGGSSTGHIYTQTVHRMTLKKQYIEQRKNFGRVRATFHLCGLYPGICLTTEEKARKNLSQGSQRVPAGTMKIHKRTIRIHRHNNKNT
jgi:hypothetical protein